MCRLVALPSCNGTFFLSFGLRRRLRMPCFRPLHQLTLLVPIPLFDLTDKLLIVPLDLGQVVIGKLPPLLFQFAFELHPFSFELISIHLILLPSPPCAYNGHEGPSSSSLSLSSPLLWCGSEPDRPLTQWPESGRLHQRTMTTTPGNESERPCANTAETGESFSLGSSRKREDGTVNGASHLRPTLGAMRVEVNYYKEMSAIPWTCMDWR